MFASHTIEKNFNILTIPYLAHSLVNIFYV